MKGKKKAAKLAYKAKQGAEVSAPRRVMLDHGHLVSNTVSFTTGCGVPRNGWSMGTMEEVRCQTCREGVT